MARKKTAKKTRARKNPGGEFLGRIFSVKHVLIFLFCAALLAGAFFGIRHFFLNTDLFAVKEIAVNKPRNYSFQAGERRLNRIYKGRNIFSVDLVQLQLLTKSEFPQLRKVEVRRVLPDRIEVDIIGRSPVAAIDSRGGVAIDREGVVLDVGKGMEGLVQIKGISFFLQAPSRGERVDNKMLDKALVLLDGLNRRMGASRQDIRYIDISDRNNIVLNIRGVSINMGTGDFSRKIDELKEIVEDPNINMKGIKYIDLRFEDAVISPK